jgi:sugar phosphate isomerase/epimerase
MPRLKIGACVQSLGLPLKRVLEEARRLQAAGVELEAVGDLAPANLSQTGRRDLRHRLKSHDLELTALACPLRHGLDVPENLEARIEHVRKVMSLSYELGAGIVILQAGKVPHSALTSARVLTDDSGSGDRRSAAIPEEAGAAFLTEALAALARHGDRMGATLALQTGLDSGATLAHFLGRFDSGSLRVNFDPANLLMGGFPVYDSARALRGRIVHCHATDARQVTASRAVQEVPLGHGDIDWLYLLGVLEEIDYHGWLTVARAGGTNQRADVAAGVQFLQRLAR